MEQIELQRENGNKVLIGYCADDFVNYKYSVMEVNEEKREFIGKIDCGCFEKLVNMCKMQNDLLTALDLALNKNNN